MSAVEKWTEDAQITGMTRYAKAYSGSGFFKDAASVEKAFVVISAGAEIGIAPFASITGIALIQGKPVIGSGLLAGLVKAHPRYDYKVRRLDDDACVLAFYEDGVEIGESSFTIADAKRANLAGKDVWKNYPRNMLFARAISNGVAFYAPDVTTTRVYVEGELDDIAPPPRPIASSRPAPASTEPVSPGEAVVDVEEVVEAAPASAHAAEDNHPDEVESEQAASTTPNQRVRATIDALTPNEIAAVKEACASLGIKTTPRALLDRFGSDAETRETLLVALAASVISPAQVEGEIAAAYASESTPEQKALAAQFEADRDAGRLHDSIDDNIAAADAAREALSARLATAGSFGES